MQEGLNSGYREYQLAANNPQSFVAPAGLAYQLIYDETISGGGTVSDAPFSDLYDDDESTDRKAHTLPHDIRPYTGLSVAG
jgi:hypothetical protein